MIKISYTTSFKKKVSKLISKKSILDKTLRKQFKKFRENPYHKGLHLHKLKGERANQYAIWIEGDLRALAIKDDDVYIFFDLIRHYKY